MVSRGRMPEVGASSVERMSLRRELSGTATSTSMCAPRLPSMAIEAPYELTPQPHPLLLWSEIIDLVRIGRLSAVRRSGGHPSRIGTQPQFQAFP